MRLVLKNLKDTQKLAKRLAKEWLCQTGPLTIALYGGLGAGKTTFVQFFARAVGAKDKVLSPTFLIIKALCLDARIDADQRRIYADILKYKRLIHIDCYRLKSAKELVALGLKDILRDKENIVVIEWPEKIARYLPGSTKKVWFEVVGEKERKIIIKNI